MVDFEEENPILTTLMCLWLARKETEQRQFTPLFDARLKGPKLVASISAIQPNRDIFYF